MAASQDLPVFQSVFLVGHFVGEQLGRGGERRSVFPVPTGVLRKSNAMPGSWNRAGYGRSWGTATTAGLVLAVLGTTGGWGVRAQDKPTAVQAPASAPAAGTPANGSAVKAAQATITLQRCRIKLKDEVTLAAGRQGVLDYVEPREGDTVRQGQQIAGVMDKVALANFAVAEKEASNDIEIRYAKKAAEVAEAEFQKALYTNILVPGTVPEIEVRKLKLASERGLLQMEQAEHQFDVAKLKRDESAAVLKTFRVEAPFDGIVTRVFKKKGESVREGDPILELSSTTTVHVEGYVTSKDVLVVTPGLPVRVQLDVPDIELEAEKEVFEGRIQFVDVKANPVSGEVRIWAEVSNKNNLLRAGLTAKMQVYLATPAQQTALQKK